MFCDLVDSTALLEHMDPEEFRDDVLDNFQRVCTRTVGRYEGHIAQYLGDGVLVYFGYPHAHEDDPRRAVNSGLEIVKAVDQLNRTQELHESLHLRVRVSIHTGPVVVGEMGEGAHAEHLALGETPNIASRIKAHAKANTVVISDATHQLVDGFYTFRKLGSYCFKGLSHPITLFHVLDESLARSRLDVEEITGLTPFTGRAEELDLLLTLWERAKAAEGHVVLIQGEPGIGKSRLVRTLKEQISHEPDTWIVECRCSPYYRNTAFYPIIDVLERDVLALKPEEDELEKLRKLEKFFSQYDVNFEEVIPIFASLLSIPVGASYKPPAMAPERRKQKIIETIFTVLLESAYRQPVLFIIEDLHWIDPSSLELISHFIDQKPANRILTLLTFRPEFIPPWGLRSHLTPVSLSSLSGKQTEEIIAHVTSGKTLPDAMREHIVEMTDGIPLFVEELTKMMLESDILREEADRYELTGALSSLAIPTTLQDSLIARLDRLSEAKEVAQLGATLGREFSYELISAVSSLAEDTLENYLSKVVLAGLLFQRGLPPEASFQFKHALVRDAAYESLLKKKRKQYHRLIAGVLLDEFPQVAETQPELVAQHYTAAEQFDRAIVYWGRAGHRALERSASLEAVAHFHKGLELLEKLPEIPDKIQKELELQTSLGNTLMTTKGYGAPEAKAALDRARELCQQVGDTDNLFPVLHGLWVFYGARAEIQTAQELALQGLEVASRLKSHTFLVESYHALGDTFFFCGNYVPARTHFEKGITLYDAHLRGAHRSPPSRDDPGVVCQSHNAIILWLLGYPDKALQGGCTALGLAREISHPYSLASALIKASLIHLLSGDAQTVRERSELAGTISKEHGFDLWSAWSKVYLGWALAMQGQIEEGITKMIDGIHFCKISGVMYLDHFRILLSEIYGLAGKIEEGLRDLTETENDMKRTGLRFYEAELYRTRGELLLMRSSPDERNAEREFSKALATARQKEAKSLELRAVMSLNRLWHKQGKTERARKVLSESHGWFTEGWDTPDLKEAKKLLQALSD
jgi:class 3 adenylate cyclase/predicted ATPase